MSKSFFDLYFSYVGDTECPRIFHRWTAVSCVAALLGRNVWLPFGHSNIYPHLYVMLMGPPGTRKSTAIKIGEKLITSIGYDHFSADRTSKEALWLDMSNEMEKNAEAYLDGGEPIEYLEMNTPTELYIVADEFNDFMGIRNEEFQTALTKMWDAPNEYKTRAKSSGNASIYKPTVNVLGGNTPGGLSKGFGVEAINGGFFSRIIFVHAEPTDTKIAFPKPPDEKIKRSITDRLDDIKIQQGAVSIGPRETKLLTDMYHKFPGIEDRRFNYYTTRRHTNLLKLAIVLAAMNVKTVLEEEDIILANTMMHVTELQMPEAFGEFGLAKHAEVTHTVMEIIKNALKTNTPVTAHDLWRHVHTDLSDQRELAQILRSLTEAGKIQQIKKGIKMGFFPMREYTNKWENGLIDYSILTESERIGEL